MVHWEEGKFVVDDVFWSNRPAWAATVKPVAPKKKIPIAINAKVGKLLGAYWKPLMRGGRGIACADGWYEWTGEKGSKQPWHINRKDRAPLFLLVLANFGKYVEHREEAGFVLVTADSLGGMVDMHDLRPVAVSAEDARIWLDPELPVEEAAHLARTGLLDAELLDWFPVSRAFNSGGDGPEMGIPVELPGGAAAPLT